MSRKATLKKSKTWVMIKKRFKFENEKMVLRESERERIKVSVRERE